MTAHTASVLDGAKQVISVGLVSPTISQGLSQTVTFEVAVKAVPVITMLRVLPAWPVGGWTLVTVGADA